MCAVFQTLFGIPIYRQFIAIHPTSTNDSKLSALRSLERLISQADSSICVGFICDSVWSSEYWEQSSIANLLSEWVHAVFKQSISDPFLTLPFLSELQNPCAVFQGDWVLKYLTSSFTVDHFPEWTLAAAVLNASTAHHSSAWQIVIKVEDGFLMYSHKLVFFNENWVIHSPQSIHAIVLIGTQFAINNDRPSIPPDQFLKTSNKLDANCVPNISNSDNVSISDHCFFIT